MWRHHLAAAIARENLETSRSPDDLSFEIGASVTDVLGLLPMGVQVDDLNHRTIYVNDKFTQMLGYTLADIADLDDWFARAYPDPIERTRIRQDWTARLAHAEATQTEIPIIERTLTCKSGEKKVIEFHVRRVGNYYIYLNTDVSARHHMEAELRRLAYTDSLTKLSNRRHFFEIGEALITDRDQPLVALMFDLDHFKALNDQYGHRIGDEVLAEVADRCRKALRSSDHIARLGGEEFGVLLPNSSPAFAARIAERLRRSVAATPASARVRDVHVTISIGVASASVAEVDIDTLMSRADRALYAAKRGGRNQICFAED
ncbi:GGDEF domain-containing protein [Acidisoma cellulosilytica]|uniref:diguanylate cyclase n=1 Tax=Acidisoma cellulosilyticum TaxID=2802395 RepID=A0A963YYF8_9PROT|nr:GGDEF domain-containing protein [Acidisoma cellulosilyticum]MCB8879568.1 GGDEF domain-containing protein [Acidisoma cellulosilyticum]